MHHPAKGHTRVHPLTEEIGLAMAEVICCRYPVASRPFRTLVSGSSSDGDGLYVRGFGLLDGALSARERVMGTLSGDPGEPNGRSGLVRIQSESSAS